MKKDYKRYCEISEDVYQKINTVKTVIFELYRFTMGCMLILFVPQKCDNRICSFDDNIKKYTQDLQYLSVFILNIFFFIFMIFLLYFEFQREMKLIAYLETNIFKPVDSKSVGNALTKLSDERKKKIIFLNKYYKIIGTICIHFYYFNVILSGSIIYLNFFNSTTITVFITNVMLLGNKLFNVNNILNTDENVFFSAFLKKNIQYNDVDPDKIENMDISL
tara:strand:+ start:1106 stop:1765 length:660 start_codon:yes stop_codon:yes gene_type:complete